MSALLHLALRSLGNRAFTATLTVVTVMLSVALLVGVERLRADAREAFLRSVSGVDLIVGARSHPVQLLLYSVFRLGDPTNNLSWETVERLQADPRVDWLVPIALGDSHRGFRVVGTVPDYFVRIGYAGDRMLDFAAGRVFSDGTGEGLFEAVVGADVAETLGYAVGDGIVLAHGTARVALQQHDDRPFAVVGVLARSGTPSDQSVFVSLPAIEAIHLNWRAGTRIRRSESTDLPDPASLQPRAASAVFLGLQSRRDTFAVQRQINDHRGEPLSAILPGVALQQLWGLLATVERVLQLAAAAVVTAALMVLLTTTLASLQERRREVAILRSVGAGRRHVFGLLLLEAGGMALLGGVSGLLLLELAIRVAAPALQTGYGLYLPARWPSLAELRLVGLVLLLGVGMDLLPAALAWRRSLQDGRTVRN